MPIRIVSANPDDYPPIFSIHVSSEVTSNALAEWARRNAADARVQIYLDEEGLSPEAVQRAIGQYVASIEISRPELA